MFMYMYMRVFFSIFTIIYEEGSEMERKLTKWKVRGNGNRQEEYERI